MSCAPVTERRPTDPYVRWHYEFCTPCGIKARALAHMHPDDSHVAWLVRQTKAMA